MITFTGVVLEELIGGGIGVGLGKSGRRGIGGSELFGGALLEGRCTIRWSLEEVVSQARGV